jgi:hypothetical protein
MVVTTCLDGGYRREGGRQHPVEIFIVLKTDTSFPLLDTKMRERNQGFRRGTTGERSGMRVVR